MDREESSVMSSLQHLMAEEECRRADQVALAQRRKLEQERRHFQQQALESERIKRQAEAASRQIAEHAALERREHERLERDRVAELERVHADLEFKAKLTLMQTEQQHELERLALRRDGRVARLEGQRLLLVALVITLVVGSGLVYAGIVRPGLRRQEHFVAQLHQVAARQRTEHELERARLDARILDLSHQLQRTQADLEAARQLPQRVAPTVQGRGRTPRHDRPSPVAKERCVNANDPLCGDLDS